MGKAAVCCLLPLVQLRPCRPGVAPALPQRYPQAAWQQRLTVPVPMGLLAYPEAILSDVMALNTLSKVGGH